MKNAAPKLNRLLFVNGTLVFPGAVTPGAGSSQPDSGHHDHRPGIMPSAGISLRCVRSFVLSACPTAGWGGLARTETPAAPERDKADYRIAHHKWEPRLQSAGKPIRDLQHFRE